MRHISLLLLLVLAPTLAAQAPAHQMALIQPARCPTADSLLGPGIAATKADLQAGYLGERGESIVFSLVPPNIPTTAGVRYTTGMLQFQGHGPVAHPALILTLRVLTDTERVAGSQWLSLRADDSLLGDSLPLALRRQPAAGLRRVLQSATVPLSHEQSLALVRASAVSGSLSGTEFTLGSRELKELRALMAVGLCGSRQPW